MTAYPKGQKVNRNKPRRLVCKEHIDHVRSLPCACCKAPAPSTAHHLMRGVVRGTGLKAGDDSTIPLCAKCHHVLHHQDGNETRFLAAFGIDSGVDLAGSIWNRRVHNG